MTAASGLFAELEGASSLMRKGAFALRRGITAARVSQLIHKGMPVERNGLIDAGKADAWCEANLLAGRKRLAGVVGTLASTKAEIETERLRLLRLEVAEKERRLVDREQARREILAAARAERDAHLTWVERTAPVVAAELGVDQRLLTIALEREMREHLRRLAETPLEVPA